MPIWYNSTMWWIFLSIYITLIWYIQKNHGAPNSLERHVGDLGNILTNSDSLPTDVIIHDKIVSLDPNSPANILGLAIVIHSGEDDLGKGGDPSSLKTGNAGSRLACGIIEIQQY